MSLVVSLWSSLLPLSCLLLDSTKLKVNTFRVIMELTESFPSIVSTGPALLFPFFLGARPYFPWLRNRFHSARHYFNRQPEHRVQSGDLSSQFRYGEK